MSNLVPHEPKNESSPITAKRIIGYLSIAVAILIAGLLISPAVPDEIIGEVILIIVIAFIEIRKKIKHSQKK